jgi:hypothetical protein
MPSHSDANSAQTVEPVIVDDTNSVNTAGSQQTDVTGRYIVDDGTMETQFEEDLSRVPRQKRDINGSPSKQDDGSSKNAS